MRKLYLFSIILFSLKLSAQLPNCAGSDSNCVFMDNGSTIFRYDPALPISTTNPAPFAVTAGISMAGLSIGPNINGGAASPTFYTTSGNYHWWNGATWVNTGHNASTVNIGQGNSAIYGKIGNTGEIYKYTGTANDVFLVNGFGNSGPYDLVSDQADNIYEIDISSTIGYIYKRNPSGVIIDTITVLNVPAQTAGPGFAMIGNKVYIGVNTSPGVWAGTIINDTVNAVALGSFNNGYGDFATCPQVPVSNTTASLVYPICSGTQAIAITSPFLTVGSTILWNFGDPASGINNTSTLHNTTHTFSGNGTYTVTTIITNAQGVDTVVNTIVVNNYIYGTSSVTICAPNSYNGYSATGVYVDTFAVSPVCDSIHTLNLTVIPLPAINLGPDVNICAGQSATLDAGAGFATYLWDNGDVTQTRVVTVSGTYYCTVTDVNSCSNTDTIDVNLNSSVNASFTIIKHLGCTEDTIELVNTTTGTNDFLWFFGDSQSSLLANPTHIYYNQMIYNVTLIAGVAPCQDTLTIPVDIMHPLDADVYVYGNAPQTQIIIPDSTCVLDKLKAQSLSIPPGLTINEFHWGDGTFDNIGYNVYAEHLYAEPGNYTFQLIITDTLGCKDSVTHQIYVDGESYAHFVPSDSIVCTGTPIVFYDTLSPYTLSHHYDFGDGSGVDNIRNPVHSYDMENNFVVTISSKNLICPEYTYSSNIVVDEYPNINLGPDTAICPGITGTIIVHDVINPAAVYTWSTGAVSNSISLIDGGHYWAMGESPNAHCKTVDSIFIARDCYLNIPNSFSPDGDGLNDYFIPRELLGSGIKTFRMNIYNRWGENIFSTTSINGRGWDGKFNEKFQPMGVYVYTIDVEFINKVKKTYQGNVTLIR